MNFAHLDASAFGLVLIQPKQLFLNKPHRPAGINKLLVYKKIKLSVQKRVLKPAEERTEAKTATKWIKSKQRKHSNGSEQSL